MSNLSEQHNLAVHLLDYGKGDHRFVSIPVPASPEGVTGKVDPVTGWGWGEMADPAHQKFRAVAKLTQKQRNRFSSHLLPDGNIRAVSENITIRLPGSPVLLPRQLKRAYMPLIAAAMDDYRQSFDISRAVIALQVRMGILEPANENDRMTASLRGHGIESGRLTKVWRSHFSATYPHIDGGSVADLADNEINPTNRWYICFNRHAPVGLNGIGLERPVNESAEDYIKSLPTRVSPTHLAQPENYTVTEIDPLAVHWGVPADRKMFRHFASVRLFHVEDADEVALMSKLPGFHNRAVSDWYEENGDRVEHALRKPAGHPHKKQNVSNPIPSLPLG